MPYSAPFPITLDYLNNKIIRKKSGRKETDWSSLRQTARFNKKGDALAQPIHLYRMWFRFLSLALELEEKSVSLVTHHIKEEIGKASGHKQKVQQTPFLRPVIVNREMYPDWDLETLRNTYFDTWWRKHEDLFLEKPIQVMGAKRDWIENQHLLHLQIDTRRRADDTIREIRELLKQADKEEISTAKYSIRGSHRVDSLINRFNALILKLTSDKPNKELFAMKDVFRMTKKGMTEKGGKNFSLGTFNEQSGKTMQLLVRPAIVTLLSVADGYFVTNPNETYDGK